jgi:hypothetical protein
VPPTSTPVPPTATIPLPTIPIPTIPIPTRTPIPPFPTSTANPPTSTATPDFLTPSISEPTVQPTEVSAASGKIDKSGYGATVRCTYRVKTDTTACRFNINVADGALPINYAVLTSQMCTEVMDGSITYVNPDPVTGATGYAFAGRNNRMVMVGKVTVRGNARYILSVGGNVFGITGPGLACGISKTEGTMIIASRFVCTVTADDPRASAGLMFDQAVNAPFQAPNGASDCHAVDDGEASFTLDYVDEVPSVGGIPTSPNGRVRFRHVVAGQYRLIDGESGTQSTSFRVPGNGLTIFHVIEFVPETGTAEKSP